MSYQDYLKEQFQVCEIKQGKYKGWICFRTPLADYRITRSDWECIKKQMIQV